MQTQAPKTKEELLSRAVAISGMSIPALAEKLNVALPNNIKHAKGWVGQLIELALGAQAGSKPEPDFPKLQVELKTIPVDEQGKVYESTFVCVVDIQGLKKEHWENSLVKRKLSTVLWVPVTVAMNRDIHSRSIGMPILWQPDEQQENLLKKDWQELTETIMIGELATISSQQGNVLQIRPKGANAKSLQMSYSETGEPIMTLPRGFYLRASFTSEIIQSIYVV